MGFWRGTRKVLGLAVDFRPVQWLDYETIKRNFLYFQNHALALFKVKKSNHPPETFEESIARQNLTPEHLKFQERRYLQVTWMFLAISASLFIYALVILFHYKNYLGAIMVTTFSLYSLIKAASYHIWVVQMREKRLGISLREYFRLVFCIGKKA